MQQASKICHQEIRSEISFMLQPLQHQRKEPAGDGDIVFHSYLFIYVIAQIMYRKIRLHSCNACSHSVQNLSSSRLIDLSKNIKTCFFAIVLYGCETRFFTLREQYRLTVFANRVLSRIFGPKGNEIIRRLEKLHNEELHNLYSSSNLLRTLKSRTMRWMGYVVRMGECIRAFRGKTFKD
jgi:hypothetical protein